jgi:hypothetical protein
MARLPEETHVRLACLRVIAAYCLATYAISIFAFGCEPRVDFFWILVAPVSFPGWLAIGFLFIGNSELPADPNTLMLEVLIFLILFVAAIWLVQLAVGRVWLSLAVVGVLVAYLGIAAIILV